MQNPICDGDVLVSRTCGQCARGWQTSGVDRLCPFCGYNPAARTECQCRRPMAQGDDCFRCGHHLPVRLRQIPDPRRAHVVTAREVLSEISAILEDATPAIRPNDPLRRAFEDCVATIARWNKRGASHAAS